MYDDRVTRGLAAATARVDAARARAARSDGVRIIAVTKGHPAAAVAAAARAGLRDVGENRVQELDSKRGEVLASAAAAVEQSAADGAAGALRWHLIGHLQRNKVRQAIPLFDLIHSVDSPRLAAELSKEAVRADTDVRALVQVNVSGEATKGGFSGADAMAQIARAAALPRLRVEGLMTMAPFTDDEGVIRATFAAARTLLEQCAAAGVELHGRELSMGMTSDYEIAIEEGSTMIRLGTILFGERLQ